MQAYKIFTVLIILLLSGCASDGSKDSSSATGQTVTKSSGMGTLVVKDIVFSEDAGIPAAVKNECNLLQDLSSHIKTAAGQYATVLEGSVAAPANADVLTIEIINLVGPGGGAWSGGKSVMIKGTLVKQGQNAGSFKALRVSGGGMWGGYMGTCAILGRCVKTLGTDVADWLRNPVDNAKLGDL